MQDNYNVPSRQIISKKQKKIIAAVTAAVILAIAVMVPVAAGVKQYFEEESSIKYYFNNDGSFKLAQGLYYRGSIKNENDAVRSLSAIKDIAFDGDYIISCINQIQDIFTIIFNIVAKFNHKQYQCC